GVPLEPASGARGDVAEVAEYGRRDSFGHGGGELFGRVRLDAVDEVAEVGGEVLTIGEAGALAADQGIVAAIPPTLEDPVVAVPDHAVVVPFQLVVGPETHFVDKMA